MLVSDLDKEVARSVFQVYNDEGVILITQVFSVRLWWVVEEGSQGGGWAGGLFVEVGREGGCCGGAVWGGV